MDIKSRSRRRHEAWRMKERMRRYWRDYFRSSSDGKTENPTPQWIGNMVATHGKPCSCTLGCGNRRRWEGPSISERRRSIADLEDLF
jgi:hypothetical protein